MLLSLSVLLLLFLAYIVDKVSSSRRRRLSASHGYTSRGFRRMRNAYEASCNSCGGAGGSSLAVFHRGQLVAELWSGLADPYSGVEWDRCTEANAYSSATFLAGICLARLAAQGHLDYAQPVSLYWPEFAANGKSSITVRQLLGQSAGLPCLDQPIEASVQLVRGRAQDDVNASLAAQAPMWPVDTDEDAKEEQNFSEKNKVFQHWTWGLYADALLQRVDPKGRRLADYFRQEIAEPHGLNIRIGDDATGQAHVGETRFLARAALNWVLLWRCVSRPEYWPSLRRLLSSVVASMRLVRREIDVIRSRASDACRGALGRSDLPSTVGGAVGTAEAFGRLLSLLCAGKIVSDQRCLQRLCRPVTQLPDANPYCGCRVAIGLCTMPLQIEPSSSSSSGSNSSWLLGCVGYGGQFVYCDLERQLSVAFLTNSLSPMSYGDDPRCAELLTAAIACCDTA